MKKIFLFRIAVYFFLLLCLCNFNASQTVRDVRLLTNSLLKVVFTEGNEEFISISPALNPGEERVVSFNVGSLKKSRVSVRVKGERKDIPKLLITEFITKGTKKTSDKVELFVVSGGNLKGLVIDYGADITVLEDKTVHKGDYLVYELEKGLPASNGYIEIRTSSSSAARIIDKVVYSIKKDDLSSVSWTGCGINPAYSTATRSINRKCDSYGCYIDTDSAVDFYITDTRCSTFGKKNSVEIYKSELENS